MSRVAWVTGSGGLIGNQIVQTGLALGEWQIRPLPRQKVDLCDFAAVQRAFRAEQPELILHCAALTQSPACQANPELAWRINCEATAHLAELAAVVRFVFFSTDLVFDGLQGNYTEEATAHPLSVYAETKLAAEKCVLANPKHTVVRTSLNAGPSPTGDRGFDEQLRLAWKGGQKPRLFVDEFRTPIAASVTARAVWEMVAHQANGLFHLAGAERLTRFEIGQLIAASCPELSPQIEPASLKEYSGAPRAPDTSLDCRKVQQILSFPLPGFRQWIEQKP